MPGSGMTTRDGVTGWFEKSELWGYRKYAPPLKELIMFGRRWDNDGGRDDGDNGDDPDHVDCDNHCDDFYDFVLMMLIVIYQKNKI